MKSALAPDNTANTPELLGLCPDKMREFFIAIDEKPFRATQLIKWIHQQGITDFERMTNLGLGLRDKLSANFTIDLPKIIVDKNSDDGTRKWLLELTDGNKIETVYIPAASRGTLCISTQVGCSLNCSFCFTAQQGYNRNLSAGEIISQLWLANNTLARENKNDLPAISNVVLMGMGEPLLNYDATLAALKLMLDDNAYGLSRWKVTLSTSGLVPKMYELAKDVDVTLAVSLHAPNDELRNQLVPINKKYPLKELIKACKDYVKDKHKMKVTFEYVMLDGVNDTLAHAKELAKLLAGVPSKVNLIPHNPFSGTDYKCSSNDAISLFQQQLMKSGINTIVRRTRGQDIDAACGQLAGKINDKTGRSQKSRGVFN